MATKSTTTAEETTQAAATTKEKKFQLEELKKKSMKLFGVTSSTFAGATADLTDTEYSVSEVQQHIEAWKKGVIKKGDTKKGGK